jgi:hypothetical protein
MLSLQDWDKKHYHKWAQEIFNEGVTHNQVKAEQTKQNGLRPLFTSSDCGAAKVFADSLRAHGASASYIKIP